MQVPGKRQIGGGDGARDFGEKKNRNCNQRKTKGQQQQGNIVS